MAAEGLKWRVNRAVQESTLPAPSRLLMFVLSDRADARTAVVPEDRTPSLADLAKCSGHSEATVKRHMGLLEANGWVVVERPSAEGMARHESNRYRLALPRGGSERAPESSNAGAQSELPAGAQSEPADSGPGAQSEPTGGSERARAGAQSEPPSFITILNDLDDLKTAPDGGATPAQTTLFADAQTPPSETEGQRVNRLTRTYTDRVPLSPFLAVQGVVRMAARARNGAGGPLYTDAQITDGLAVLVKENRAVSANALRIAIEGAPRASPNSHAPWRNPTDPSVYHEAI